MQKLMHLYMGGEIKPSLMIEFYYNQERVHFLENKNVNYTATPKNCPMLAAARLVVLPWESFPTRFFKMRA